MNHNHESLLQTQAAALEEIGAFLDPSGIIGAADDNARYSRDWTGDYAGTPLVVVRPRTTDEVAAIVRICAKHRLPVIPQGGHTGLVGGATPTGGEIVISLERMDQVLAVDPVNFSMVVQSGCVLQAAHQAAEAKNCFFPLKLGAQGSCQIGGNIATNAGGVNVLRFGMMRDLVLGLEVVLPNGDVLNRLTALRKDNTGYDLKQLFIGSEGTLGIVTAAALKLFPKPTMVETAFLAVESVSAAMELYALARSDLSDLLSAFELIPREAIDLAVEKVHGIRNPLSTETPYYVLLEAAASGMIELRSLVERFFEARIMSEHILDGALAENSRQAEDFWRIREGMVEAQVLCGKHLRTDVSVAISSLPKFIDEAHASLSQIAPNALSIAYGHVGDGNIHFNVIPSAGLPAEEVDATIMRCEAAIYEVVDRLGGSISAEHGIGRTKKVAFQSRATATQLEMLRAIKTALDPHGLMSPGRLLDLHEGPSGGI